MLKILVKEKNTTDAWESLYLPENIEFTYKLTNPALTDMGDFSYPITVDYELNKHIFKFPSEGEWMDREFEFQLFFGEDKFINGDVEILNADGIEFSLKSGNSAVSNVLNDSFLDDEINGKSWGERGQVEVVDTLDGFYPEYDFVATPIKGKGAIIYNKSYYTKANGLIQNTICPSVYVRYLLDRIIWALGYFKDKDEMDGINDLKRLYVFSARTPGFINSYKDWLPNITAIDFLRSIRERFGFFIKFSPSNFTASILSINRLLENPPVDLTEKLSLITTSERYRKKTILLSNEDSTDEDDLIDISTLIDKADLILPPLPNLNPDTLSYEDVEDNEGDLIRTPKIYSPETERVFKKIKTKGDDKIAYLQKTTKHTTPRTYYNLTTQKPDEDTTSIEKTSSSQVAGNLYLIAEFWIEDEIFPDVEELQAISVLIDVKKNAGDAHLVVTLDTRGSGQAWHASTLITNSSFETKVLLRRCMHTFSYLLANRRGVPTTRVYTLGIYSYSAIPANTLTVRFGGTTEESGVGSIPALISFDPSFYEWKEIGRVGNYKKGDKSLPDEEVKPSGMVMTNTYGQIYGLFEMPLFPHEHSDEQKKFGFSIFRGAKKEIPQTTLPFYNHDRVEGFSSFDDLTIEQKHFDETTIYPSPLTLRWREEKGIVNKLLNNHLFNRHNKFRPVTALLNFTYFDLITFDITQPVMLNAQRYLFEELSLPISNRGIGEITAELVTI